MVDAVLVQILRSKIASLVDETHYHFFRSVYSTIIRESRDFSCVILDGAARELREEAGVIIAAEQLQLYMTGTITFINQVYVAFRATVDSDTVCPGVESQDCQFLAREDCPWKAVAYPQVNDSIHQAYRDLDSGEFQVWQAEMTEDRYQLQPVLTRR